MDTSTPSDALSRHQARRTQGVPTVTALVGPTGLGMRAWRAWCSGECRSPAVFAGADLEPALSTWVTAAFAAVPPTDRASAWLTAALARTPQVTAPDVGRMTRYDLELLRNALPTDPQSPVAAAAFFILNERALNSGPDATRFVRALLTDTGVADPVTRVTRAVTELYPPERCPALLLVPPTEGGERWCVEAARVLERIANASPRVPVGVTLTHHDYVRLLDQYPESRTAVLVREGFVEIRGVNGNQLEERLRTAGVAASPATIDRLTTEGLAEEVAEAFVAASQAVRHPTATDIESDFRSVHEGFLFAQLESMPQTAGLFRPNYPLEFRHGQKTAEGDLVAESLKLAVEVDGGFYHLTADQYRRDRRKDWLYQRGGYLVLRFLAEDVVSDLELILNTILEAVTFRRASLQPPGAV